VTTINYPCPTCSQQLFFERSEPGGRIKASCDECRVEYSMGPDGVRVEPAPLDEPPSVKPRSEP